MSVKHSPKRRVDERGQTVMYLLTIASITVLFLSGFAGWTAMNLKALRHTRQSSLALLIAESGVEYYRWHLNHAPADFKDGTNSAGPYVHNFYDADGDLLGTYTLAITAPSTGSTVAVVKSTGRVTTDPSIKRIVQVSLAKPSLAKYAVVANAAMRFGEGTEVFGPIHSNGGIRFDGLAHNVVTSAVTDYSDPDHSGADEFGVHTHVMPPPLSGSYSGFVSAEAPNNSVPARTDVFEAGRSFPVPAVDFDSITADLAQMKSDAQSAGRYFSSSGTLGYRVVLKTNDTFDLYKVTSLVSTPSGCNSNGESGWGTWSINAQTFQQNYAIPSNGLIFIEDNAWVEGTISTARVTISAANLGSSSTRSITVNNDLKYTYYDGSDSLALIAQENINIGLISADTIRIDAALLAQNGRVGRYYYSSSCGTSYMRTQVNLFGMIATNKRYGFAWSNSSGDLVSGYDGRSLTYDATMLFAPPPSFPGTSDNYQLLYWKEVKS